MNDPIKIIWKFKNNNRRNQYHQYIFIGEISKNIKNILDKITDDNLYDSLIKLSKSELNTLSKFYGDYWYDKFFNIYHIMYSLHSIKESKTQQREIIDKFGQEWYDKHVNLRQIINKKILYNFATSVKNETSNKSIKKNREYQKDNEDNMDYTTVKNILDNKLFVNSEINKIRTFENNDNMEQYNIIDTIDSNNNTTDSLEKKFKKHLSKKNKEYINNNELEDSNNNESEDNNNNELEDSNNNESEDNNNNESEDNNNNESEDGNDNESEDGNDNESEDSNNNENISQNGGENDIENNPEINNIDELEDNVKNIEKNTDELDEEFNDIADKITDDMTDLEELEKLYQTEETDNNASKTGALIKQALDNDKLFENKLNQMIDFDISKDNNIYDEKLKDNFKKFYVLNNYIFKDDTIKIIKDKITCSFKNNIKFGKNSYILPSRQYLWSEYFFDNNIDKVMLGQRWMRRTELLAIDIEPNNNFRYYEDLVGQIKLLRDNIKRYSNKIKSEDNNTNILYEYDNYILNNEIYMIDIYNEFGFKYKPSTDTIKNLYDVYLKLYFPKIKFEDIKNIIDYLNPHDADNIENIEANKMSLIFETINNDIIIDNEITNIIEATKYGEINKAEFKEVFGENYITQSTTNLFLKIVKNTNSEIVPKINLYKIFNDYEVNEEYPFIQYQTPDSNIIYKFDEKAINSYIIDKTNNNKDILTKWFENAPFGINFKIKYEDLSGERFMAVTLIDTGKIEYKTQWREENKGTIYDIKKTYDIIRKIVLKLNSDKNKMQFEIPTDDDFKFAFLNSIQKFNLPKKFIINHNDLSEFSRYFYPYVALVIEPKKRQSKINKSTTSSKFGTYLRYKRISKYDNHLKIEQRILYFMKNYEYTSNMLITEISKQFNITEEKALDEIEKVKLKFPNIKKSRILLKKMDIVPKYKPLGIGIDIQGKQRENYKIKIAGARDFSQLERISLFTNILLYLYVETYLLKKSERQNIKDRLKKLSNIARRRNKVDDIVTYESDNIKIIKLMTKLDKNRLGYKPDKGQDQYSRYCQNSGEDKKRRPQQYLTNVNMNEMIKLGYILNKKTGVYERKLKKGKYNKTDITLQTIKLADVDAEGNPTGNDIYYACDPDNNGEHMYIGFLTKSKNPFGLCMPCCFKKDAIRTNNKEKQKFYQECLGQEVTQTQTQNDNIKKYINANERLYILQDTNKIQENRFGFMPKYLDIFFNVLLGKIKKIKQHFLIKTETGYYFKYGSKQGDFPYINAIAVALDISVDIIKNKIIEALDKDTNIFTYINNGDIKNQYGDKDTYLNYIKNNSKLDYEDITNLLSIPEIITKHGLNIIVFIKKIIIIKKTFEKEKIIDDFTIDCNNLENEMLLDPNRTTIFIIKENMHYYPIFLVTKKLENNKNMEITKIFKYNQDKDNIVNHILDFYEKNCKNTLMNQIVYKNSLLTARETNYILKATKDKNLFVRFQTIDVRNKCKYLITYSGIIIPVRSSGIIYDVQMIKSIDKYVKSFKETLDNLKILYNISNQELKLIPHGVYCDNIDDKNNDNLDVIAIITKNKDVIPVIQENIKISELNKLNLLYENKPLTDYIDKILDETKNIKNNKNNIDERIINIKLNNYEIEGYELFRLEFSNYINMTDNKYLKTKIYNIVNNTKIQDTEKVDKLRLIIYRLIDKDIYDKYKNIFDIKNDDEVKDIQDNIELDIQQDNEINIQQDVINNQEGGKYDKLINIISKVPDTINYIIRNDRQICEDNNDKDICNANIHCRYNNGKCYFSLTKELIVKYVNKLTNELISNELKYFEIMQIDNYFISDIVSYNKFTEKRGQKIIRSNSDLINKTMKDIFGKDNMPRIGKKQQMIIETDYKQLNLDNPIIEMKEFYLQKIIDSNITLFRAYINGYYWLKNQLNTIDSKNLGYYSALQTELSNYFKGVVIDWLNTEENKEIIEKDIIKYMNININIQKNDTDKIINKYILNINKNSTLPTSNYIPELIALSYINMIPIVIYDDDANVRYIFDNGLKYNALDSKIMSEQIKKYTEITNKKNYINLRFIFINNNMIPDNIEVIYYK